MDANEIRPAITANRVPTPTLERLATYLKCLHDVAQAGVTTISSAALQEMAGINASQFRKDLSYFGEFGRPGVGYHVADLHDRITAILHMDVDQRMLLVGAGNLGAALAGYTGLNDERLQLVAAFDNDPARIGRKLGHSKWSTWGRSRRSTRILGPGSASWRYPGRRRRLLRP